MKPSERLNQLVREELENLIPKDAVARWEDRMEARWRALLRWLDETHPSDGDWGIEMAEREKRET